MNAIPLTMVQYQRTSPKESVLLFFFPNAEVLIDSPGGGGGHAFPNSPW